jgi:hypothetical protein
MQMGNKLPGIFAAVDDQPVSGLIDALALCCFIGNRNHISHQFIVGWSQVCQSGYVLYRHYQQVGGGEGMNILKNDDFVVLINKIAGIFPSIICKKCSLPLLTSVLRYAS